MLIEMPEIDRELPPTPRKGLAWRANAKGNLTVRLGDFRATCFKQKDGCWRFCVATTTWYDQPFAGQEEAMEAAEAMVKSQLL